DFQWADAESVALVREVMHPDSAPPVLLLVTMRPAHADAPDLTESFEMARRLQVSGLGAAEAEKLATLALGEKSDAAMQIARETKGHPLFVLEMARYARETGGDATMATNLDDAIWARIRNLEEPARHLLEVLAVAGSPLLHRTAALAGRVE